MPVKRQKVSCRDDPYYLLRSGLPLWRKKHRPGTPPSERRLRFSTAIISDQFRSLLPTQRPKQGPEQRRALEQIPFKLNRELALGFCFVAFSNAQPLPTWSENALALPEHRIWAASARMNADHSQAPLFLPDHQRGARLWVRPAARIPASMQATSSSGGSPDAAAPPKNTFPSSV